MANHEHLHLFLSIYLDKLRLVSFGRKQTSVQDNRHASKSYYLEYIAECLNYLNAEASHSVKNAGSSVRLNVMEVLSVQSKIKNQYFY